VTVEVTSANASACEESSNAEKSINEVNYSVTAPPYLTKRPDEISA
jgi:hypothetical protein